MTQPNQYEEEYPAAGKPFPVDCDKCDELLKMYPNFPMDGRPVQHYMYHVPSKWNNQYEDKELEQQICKAFFKGRTTQELNLNEVEKFCDIRDIVTPLITQKQKDAYIAGTNSAKGTFEKVALEARIDELKDLKALHSRTYTQKVTDNMGNEYVSDTHSYISSYETQERISKLEAELTKQEGKDERI